MKKRYLYHWDFDILRVCISSCWTIKENVHLSIFTCASICVIRQQISFLTFIFLKEKLKFNIVMILLCVWGGGGLSAQRKEIQILLHVFQKETTTPTRGIHGNYLLVLTDKKEIGDTRARNFLFMLSKSCFLVLKVVWRLTLTIQYASNSIRVICFKNGRDGGVKISISC